MALSITDILRDLGSDEETTKVAMPESVEETTKVAEAAPDVEKVALYLEALAQPDSIVDELAKLAVLQDWVSINNIPMDKLASANIEIRDEQRITMMKTASELVRTLNKEVAQLNEKLELHKLATDLTKKMYTAGHIGQDELLDKVAELSEQPREELRTLDRALDLTKTATRFGSLSENRTESDNPFLDFILS